MFAQQPPAFDRDQALGQIADAQRNGWLTQDWTVANVDGQPIFCTEIPLSQRAAILQVAYAGAWRANYSLLLPEDETLDFDYSFDGVGDFLEALAIAEQWLQDDLKG